MEAIEAAGEVLEEDLEEDEEAAGVVDGEGSAEVATMLVRLLRSSVRSGLILLCELGNCTRLTDSGNFLDDRFPYSRSAITCITGTTIRDWQCFTI